MTFRRITAKDDKDLAKQAERYEIGQAANHFAGQAVFDQYRGLIADNTRRTQDAGLELFAEFLNEKFDWKASGERLSIMAEAWSEITHGLVTAFVYWQLDRGYAVSTVNARLSTIKRYAKLAYKAGTLTGAEYGMIKAVEGFQKKQYARIDAQRENEGIDTRRKVSRGMFDGQGKPVGTIKKASSVLIPEDRADMLKEQPDDPQGRRDRLLMCLLLDHGLRVSEVAILERENIDLENGVMTIYRPKVDRTENHKMTGDTWRAARAYLEQDAPETSGIWRGSRRGRKLTNASLSIRSINNRVRALGERVGIEGLSPHDCRHYGATLDAPRLGMRGLMDKYGWTSAQTAIGYIESAKVIEP